MQKLRDGLYFDPADWWAVVERARPFSMVSEEGLLFTIEALLRILAKPVQGAIVECGTWKGGASLAMLMAGRIQGHGRRVHMFDSFQGLPPATEADGPAALRWQQDTGSKEYYDNCTASRQEVEEMLASFGFVVGTDAIIYSGLFASTLPLAAHRFRVDNQQIALLRLDCDWYDSTSLCLEQFGPLLAPGAAVIVDDYYAWDGCARAVHEYLAGHDLPYRIRQIGPHAHGAFFVVE